MGDMSPLGLDFSLEVDASADLAFDDDRADALVTIRARTSGGAADSADPRPAAPGPAPAPSAEILIMDRSLSMAGHGKLSEAQRAMCAAVDSLRDGTLLGIVAGHHEAEVVYPPGGGLALADASSRAAAKLAVLQQLPEGGTAIGTWLACADRLFTASTSRETVRHAVLYTDGKDEHETSQELDTVLAACADRFVCDARGLGHDWNYTELLRITEALHGTAKAVVTVSDLTRDFTELMEQARRIVVSRVYLGLRLNSRFRLGFVRQTRPVEAELTAQRQDRDGEIHIPLGSWAPEARQYQVSLSFDPGALPVEEDLRASRLTLRAERPGGERTACAESAALVVRRRATPDVEIHRSANLTRAENMRELGMAMRACADAGERGDQARADRELRLALRLAESLGDAERLAMLRAVAETGPDGRPRVRRDAPRGAMQRLGLESVRTGAPPLDPTGTAPGAGPVRRTCPRCGATTSAAREVRHCEECGYVFGPGEGNSAEGEGGRRPQGGDADNGRGEGGRPGSMPGGAPVDAT
jgi:VWA domain-containing protein